MRNLPHRCLRLGRVGIACLALALVALPLPIQAQESPRPEIQTERGAEFGRMFDAAVEAINKSFWDKERLKTLRWMERAAAVRPAVVASSSLDDAARRINALLDELGSSHIIFLTPDDADYYVLRGVFGRPADFAGIGLFTTRIDGRDFIDLLLEGFPADHAGLKVGDEIVSVDGKPYHPIRSFRGKAGREAEIGVRRARDGPLVTVDVDVVNIDALAAFNEATITSAHVVERNGRRIGYVHVWASLQKSQDALNDALIKIGAARPSGRRSQPAPRSPDAVVIDMRGKIGGMAGSAGRYLDIIDPRGPAMQWQDSNGVRPDRSNRGRTAVLIDHHTRSTGELFVHSYKRERQGPLIGTSTAGAVSGSSAVALPGDTLLQIAVSGLVVDGEVLEGPGVAPDVVVQRPLPYSAGADPVLDAALSLMAERVTPRAAPAEPEPKGEGQ